MADDIFVRDSNNQLAVNTVVSTEANVPYNYDDCFTLDTNNRRALRVVSAGGGGSVDYSKTVQKTDTMPIASSSNAGQVYLYTGTTDSDYTQNYIYKNVESTEYSSTVEFNPASISSTTVTCSGDDFIALIEEFGSGNITDIIKGTLTYDESGELLVFVGLDDTDTQVCTFQLYTQDYIDAGFTFTGTLEDGDVIAFTTDITESASYSWVRIDVQPAGAGIDWTGHWDMPADTEYGYICPRFDFEKLPNGTYEFYYQYKELLNSYDTKSWYPKTVYVKFTKNNGYYQGCMNIIMDGQTGFVTASKLTDSGYLYYMYDDDNDYLLSPNNSWVNPLVSDGNLTSSVPNIYQWTDIKNVDTGTIYPVTVTMGHDSPVYPDNYSFYDGNISTGDLVNIPSPSYMSTNETTVYTGTIGAILFNVGGIWQQNINNIMSNCLKISIADAGHNNVFNAEIHFYANGQYYTVKEATGIFVDSRIGYSVYNDSPVYIIFDSPLVSDIVLQVAISTDGSKNSIGGLSFFETPLSEFHEFDRKDVGATITPTTLGTVLQYTGATDANYTNGYFYKATGNIVTVPSTVDCASSDPNFTVTMTDVDGFIRYMETFGYNQDWVESQLDSSYFTYDVDTNSMVWGPYGTFSSADSTIILGFFNITPALGQGDYVYWDTSNFVKGSQSVQNAVWQQMNVQPTVINATGYDPAKTQILKNVQGVLTWVDE